MGAKGYAVRLPEDMQGAFEARCKQLGVTTSSALQAAVLMWLAPRPVEAKSSPRQADASRLRAQSAGHRVRVQIGPTEPKPGSRLKVKK